MVNFGNMVAKPQSVVYPIPSQKTLDLLKSYGVTYPGNQFVPTPIETVSLSENDTNLSIKDIIMNFLTQIYPKIKPNNYAKMAITLSNPVVTDPDIKSNIYNFYTVTANQYSDILPSDVAMSLNSSIIDLEKTYNKYALQFITNLFNTHVSDTTNNPHEDNFSNLVNLWNNFFQTLYNEYTSVTGSPISLDAFIINKTVNFNLATINNYENADAALFIVDIEVIDTLIAQHNNAVDSSIHPTLQAIFQPETNLPSPSLYITPDFSILVQLSPTTSGNYYYQPTPLKDMFSRMNASFFVQSTIDMNSSTTINILNFSCSTTTDTLSVLKLGSSSTSYQINMFINNISYEIIIPLTSGNVVFALNYTTTGVVIFYVNDQGNTVSITETIPNLTLDFDTFQIGIQMSYLEQSISNTMQKLVFYRNTLSTDQVTVLFQTLLT